MRFRDAIRFPILVYNNVNFKTLEGEIIFKCEIKKGLIKIGLNTDQFGAENGSALIDVGGRIIFNGPVIFSINNLINVGFNSVLEIGRACAFGNGVKIRCWKDIKIGDSVRVGLESQIFDTNFHYVLESVNKTAKNNRKRIIIDDFVWIGNRTTVSPGAIIPRNSIVASNSLVNIDFSKYQKQSLLIGGVPAKLIGENLTRIFDLDIENKLNVYFSNSDFSDCQENFLSYSEDLIKMEKWFLELN
ncbi:MAG: acyltransferase [Bacteroidota bacterium]